MATFPRMVRLAVLIGLLPVTVWAQYQRSMQVDARVANSNPEPNAASMMYAQPNYIQNPVLPSQERFARVQSGKLSTELQMEATAAGPLVAGGSMSYIGKPTPLQQATQTPKQAPTGAMAAPTASSPPPAVPNGSLRYSGGGTPMPDQRVSGTASNAQSLLSPAAPQPAAAQISPQIYRPPAQHTAPTPSCGR
jgi:hypothetical protein